MQTNSTGDKKPRSFGGSFWSKPQAHNAAEAKAPALAHSEETAATEDEPRTETAPTRKEAGVGEPVAVSVEESPQDERTPDLDEPTSEDELQGDEQADEPDEPAEESPQPGEPADYGEDEQVEQADEPDKPADDGEDEQVEGTPEPGEPADDGEDEQVEQKAKRQDKSSDAEAKDAPRRNKALPQAKVPPRKLLPESTSRPHRQSEPKRNTPRTPASLKQNAEAAHTPKAGTKADAQPAPTHKAPPSKKPSFIPTKNTPKRPSRWDKYPAVRKAKKVWSAHRTPAIIISSTLLSLIAIYVVGGIFFSRHFLPHTTVNGNDVSLLTRDTFANRINSEVEGYTAHVTGDGVDLNISGSEVGLKLDTDTYVTAATSQLPAWAWPFILLSQHDYTVSEGVSLDESKVNQLVSAAVSQVNQNPTPTTNASFAYDADTSDYSAIKEKLGTEVDDQAAVNKVAINMQGLNPTITLGDEELVQPAMKVGDPQFKEAITQARDYPDLTIDLLLGSDVATTLEPSLIRSWLVLGEGYTVTGDLDAISEYTRGTLSAKLDTVAAYRTYTRPDGKKIQINDGTYGWNIDGAQLAQLIVERINEKSSEAIEIPCNSTAAVYNPGGADWGDRYIDVDLTEQYARMYVDGDQVWGSECVSGGPASGNDTVTGVFAIEGKESPMKLIGLDSNGDGEPDYENDVTFWMPFWGGYGLHDATWRYTFGGDEYLSDGSHGCVNLPYGAAESLYYEVEIGDPVIVHW